MIKKLAVFPFDRTVSPLARYHDMLDGYSISALLIPSYVGLDDHDVSVTDGGTDVGMYIKRYHTDEIEKCDTLLVIWSSFLQDESLYQSVINEAIKKHKEVLVTKKLRHKFPALDLRNISCIDDDEEQDFDGVTETEIFRKIYKIDVPVIAVMDMGEHCDRFHVEMTARKYFVEHGYKISHITSDPLSQFYNLSQIPPYIWSNINIEDKILRFNHDVRNLVKREEPDLLIMSVPGGIMKYNDCIPNGFGVIPYIMMNAVQCDISVVSVYYNEYKECYFDELSQYCKYRLNCDAKYFNIANTKVSDDLENEYALQYLFLKSDYVLTYYDNKQFEDFKLFNSLDYCNAQKAYADMEHSLLNNVCTL